MRICITFLAFFLVLGISSPALAQWTTTSQFSTISLLNGDGQYPTPPYSVLGNAQFTVGANWTGGYTDLSLINSNLGNTSGGGFSFWQMTGASSKKMLAYMQGNGYVGFGGIIPSRALEVRGTNPIFRIGNSTPVNTQVNTVIGGIEFPTSGENAYMAKINANVGQYSDQPYLTFHTGPTSAEQLRITQFGNVGIGNPNPPSKLSVNGEIYSKGHMWLYAYEGESSSGTAYIQARNYAAGTNLNLQFRTQNAGQIVETMRLTSAGNVGIGTTNPITRLDVNGNLRTTTGRFSGFYSSNSDGLYPATYIKELGAAQLTIGANWTGGATDLSLINSNIANISGGGFSFWQMTDSTSKKMLAYIRGDGSMGIGTTNPGSYKLAVEGKIGAREVEVKTGSWADFVFKPDYHLRPLSEVARFIQTHQHLPEIPSEAEVKEKGISLGEMNAKLLQKIEELTLYVLEQQKEIDELKRQVASKK